MPLCIFLTADITSKVKCSVLLHKTSEELRQWLLEWMLRKLKVIICTICWLIEVRACGQNSFMKSQCQCLCRMTFNVV